MRPGVACNAQYQTGKTSQGLHRKELAPRTVFGGIPYDYLKGETRTMNTENGALHIGWKAVGIVVGRTSHYLTQTHARGLLPVEPLRFGAQVAYTPDMAEALRVALEARATAHRRAVRPDNAATE